MSGPPRTLVVSCPDWPVWAWGVPAEAPAAVLVANRVVAANPAARAVGVVEGLRRRDAQSRCPDLAVLGRDLDREARAFAQVLLAVEAFAPYVEVAQSGTCAVATRGPARYFGGDEALAVAVHDAVEAVLGRTESVLIGVADGWFAASMAARFREPGDSGQPRVVAPGQSAAFLAPLPLLWLSSPSLVDVLGRLGLSTFGGFAALDPGDILGRFGAEGRAAHRLARGLDTRPLDTRSLPPDLAEEAQFDPPVDRVDQAAFVAKGLADRLQRRLETLGLSCTRVLVEAETEHGESCQRLWRAEGALTPAALVDRVRWQLDGWLQGPVVARPSGGLVLLRLLPDQVVPASGRQLGFWGGDRSQAERAARASARVQGLLGVEAVSVVERGGGRDPGEQLVLVAAAAVDLTEREPLRPAVEPWPGRLPVPPASVWPSPCAATLADAEHRVVEVSGRGLLSAAPAWVAVAGGTPRAVTGWAGPWPLEERWWDPVHQRRQARMQVVLEDGSAHLLLREGGSWWLAATFD